MPSPTESPIPPEGRPLPDLAPQATKIGQRTVDGELAALARVQHGVVAVAQLRELGLSRSAIQKRERSGRLHRIYWGVYAVGHTALGRQGRRLAVVLACGPGAALSHVSAAEAWGMLGGSASRWHVTVPRMSGGRRGPDAVMVHRTLALPPSDVTMLGGVPVTSVARTLVDLAAVVDLPQMARAVHEAEVLRLLDTKAVHALLAVMPRKRGVAGLRRLIMSRDPDVDTQRFVEAFLRLCSGHGLPRPAVGVHLHVADRLVEADILFREQRLVVELDGEQVHHTRKNFHSDRRRDAALAAEGIQTIRLTWERVTKEAPATATELRRILRARSA